MMPARLLEHLVFDDAAGTLHRLWRVEIQQRGLADLYLKNRQRGIFNDLACSYIAFKLQDLLIERCRKNDRISGPSLTRRAHDAILPGQLEGGDQLIKVRTEQAWHIGEHNQSAIDLPIFEV